MNRGHVPSVALSVTWSFDRNECRLYSAYVLVAAWGLGVELVGVWLYVSLWWKPVATMLIGR